MEIKSLRNLIAMETQKLHPYKNKLEELNLSIIKETTQEQELQIEILRLNEIEVKENSELMILENEKYILREQSLSISNQIQQIQQDLVRKEIEYQEKLRNWKKKHQLLIEGENLNTRANIKKLYEKTKVYKKYYSQSEIDALPMIEIDPLTNMFKSNPNVERR
jgi:hypothetical protein